MFYTPKKLKNCKAKKNKIENEFEKLFQDFNSLCVPYNDLENKVVSLKEEISALKLENCSLPGKAKEFEK